MAGIHFWCKRTKAAGRTAHRIAAGRPRLGARLCRLEPLEQRTVLSVISPLGDPAAEVSAAAAGDGVDVWRYMKDPLHIAVWTPERIADVQAWVAEQQWPDIAGPIDPEHVTELLHQRLLVDPRGGYKTTIAMGLFTTAGKEDLFAALKELDFVDYVKLASEDFFRHGPDVQEAIDNITTGGSDAPIRIPEDDFQLMVLPAVEEQNWLDESVRIGVWTADQITDVGDWVDSKAWPETMHIDRNLVTELVHIRVLTEARGGYVTILKLSPVTQLSPDDAVAALASLDFVEFARLESKSVIQYGPRTQELLDATKMDAGPGEAQLFGELRESNRPVSMRVTFWTPDPMEDAVAFVRSQDWPDGLLTSSSDAGNSPSAIREESVTQLASIPLLSEARGGYFTIVRVDAYGDITKFDSVDFIEYARLEADSVVRFNSHVQGLIDATKMDAGEGEAQLFMAESRDLIAVDSFHDDQRFLDVDGSGLAVAIIDTGIDSDHDFFQDRVVYGYDFYGSNDEDPTDYRGHGTHVASIAAGFDEEGDYSGVAPGADIVALKVFPDSPTGGAPWTDIEEALQWVVAHADEYQIVSVNMSLGDGNYQTATSEEEHGVYDQIADLAAMGVIVVSAAGNSFHAYSDAQGVAYPAADPNSLAVGAVYDANLGRRPEQGYVYGDYSYANTTDADRITPYSQRHATLTTVMAPGEMITGAWLDNGTNSIFGTSMAAPHIAGMAVLAQQLAVQELGQPLTQDQFIDLLQETGTTIEDGDDEDDNVTNTGEEFKRADMFALAEGILDLHWQVDAGDDAGDGTPDTFVVSRYLGNLYVTVNGTQLDPVALDDVVRLTVTGSSDADAMTVGNLSDFQGNVVLVGQNDAADTASLYDTTAGEKFRAWPNYATLECDVPDTGELAEPNAYTVTADNFRNVHAYASYGGTDIAFLYGATGDDGFLSEPDYGKLYDASATPTYVNRAKYFDYVNAYGQGGTDDVAYLYDSPGDDFYIGTPTYGKLYREGTGNFSYRVKTFDYVHAYAASGGYDTATLLGSTGHDESIRRYDYVNLYNDDHFHRAKYFDSMTVGGNGGDDTAWLFDSTLDDLLTADDNWAQLENTAWLAKVLDFATVHAISENGGDDDTAILPPLPFTLNLYGPWDQ